jgi:hypothetical protein
VIHDLSNSDSSDLMRGVEDTAYEEAYLRVLEERGVTGMLIIQMGLSIRVKSRASADRAAAGARRPRVDDRHHLGGGEVPLGDRQERAGGG